MKRILSILLILTMLCGFCTAFAAEEAPAEETPAAEIIETVPETPAAEESPAEGPAAEEAPAEEVPAPETPAEEIAAQPAADGVTSGKCGENVSWALDTVSGRLTVTGTGAMYDYSEFAAIPWYTDCRGEIRTVEIGSGVTSIGAYSFYGCSALTAVSIPDSVTKIGAGAFCGTALAGIILSDYVTELGVGVFENCKDLKTAVIGAGITIIPHYTFTDCSALQDVTLPAGVTQIKEEAFANCRCLQSLTFPNSLISIGDSAFANTGLVQAKIPEGVRSIGPDAFLACGSMTDIYLYSADCAIGSEAIGYTFDGQSAAYLSRTVCVHGYTGSTAQTYADALGLPFRSLCAEHQYTAAVTAMPAADTAGIMTYTCSVCGLIHTETIPALGTNGGICGASAYWRYDPASGTLTIGGTGAMTGFSAGEAPWYGYRAEITTLTTDSGVTEIGAGAFAGCTGLTDLYIYNDSCAVDASIMDAGSGVTIHGNADSAARTYAKANGLAFECLTHTWNDGTITTPPTITGQGEKTFTCTVCGKTRTEEIPAVTVMSGECGSDLTWTLDSVTGTLTISGTGDMADYAAGTAPWSDSAALIGTVSIGSGVTGIGSSAFAGCALTAITIPANVTTIGENSIGPGVTVRGYVNSAAQSYAKANSLTFVPLYDGTGWTEDDVTGRKYYFVGGVMQTGTVTIGAREFVFGSDGALVTCGHIYTSEVTAEPTCGKSGICTYTCTVCGSSCTEDIPATGRHSCTAAVTTEPTTLSAGIRTCTCTVCGVSYTEEIPMLPIMHEGTGWEWADGYYYYFENSVMVISRWVCYGGSWYYMDADGRMVTGVYSVPGDTTYYFSAGGAMNAGCWLYRNGSYYYFGSDGRMVKNNWVWWGAWYYMDANGRMITNNWQYSGGAYYYFGSDGIMVSSSWVWWGAYYYMGADGRMLTDSWLYDGGAYYYLGSDGVMVSNNWVWYGGHYYYMNASGAMVTGTYKVGSTTYHFDSNGIWLY